MDNMNFDKNMLDNLKNVFGDDKVSSALSNISPEMLNNFSKIMSQNDDKSGNNNSSNKNTTVNSNNESYFNGDTNNSNPFDSLDINTIMKMKTIFDQINSNNKNDPRANLLNSLKPYLRDTRQDKIDKYLNILKFSDIANMLNKNESGDKK